jgi:hypothetical protein
MAPKPKAKGEPGGLIDEDTLAECKRLQSLAFEGVSEGVNGCSPADCTLSSLTRIGAHRCCPSPAKCAEKKPRPAKVSYCLFLAGRQAAVMHTEPDLYTLLQC